MRILNDPLNIQVTSTVKLRPAIELCLIKLGKGKEMKTKEGMIKNN